MKKTVLSFALLFFLCFIPSVSALSFTVNETEYQVSDSETLRDYCYFTYTKPGIEEPSTAFPYLIVYQWTASNVTNYFCLTKMRSAYFDNSVFYYDSSQDYLWLKRNGSDLYYDYYSFDSSFNNLGLSGRVKYSSYTSALYSNTNIYSDITGETLSFSANFSYDDIENKYSSSQNEDPEEPISSTSEITKEEFYVLLMLLSTLIFMLFFKWTFPNKGGKNI